MKQALLLIHTDNISLNDFALLSPIRRVMACARDTFALYKSNKNLLL